MHDQGKTAPQEVADDMLVGIDVGGLDRNNNIRHCIQHKYSLVGGSDGPCDNDYSIISPISIVWK